MAKKQQIILTHGALAPTEQAIKDLKLGEVLVQHAADAKEAALHTVLEEGNVEKLVSFPSKEWVDQKIKDVNTAAGQLESTVSALQTQVDGIDAAYKAADKAMDAAYKAADTKIREDFAAADTAIRGEFAAADTVLEGQITALDARVEANEGAISGLTTTVSEMDAAYKAADKAMDAAYKAADKALEDRVDGKLAGKVDKATVEALDTRVAANANAITNLVAADTAIRNEFAAADSAITEAYTLADATLKNELTTEINKKANQTDFEALKDSVEVIQGADTTKSMRTVAEEEAAKKVAEVVANADADFDTLKEIADWILNDKTGAAALKNDVADLKDVVEGYEGKGAIKAADDKLAGQISALDTRVAANASAITALQAADTKIREDFADADDKIREDFAKADTDLKTELNGEIDKKADKTAVAALDTRVTNLVTEVEKNEETTAKALTDLDTRVTKVSEDFAAADSALETKLNGEIEKKANKTAVEALDGRVTVVEGAYVKTIKYMDATGKYVELSAVNNVIDLSGMVIDGGEY